MTALKTRRSCFSDHNCERCGTAFRATADGADNGVVVTFDPNKPNTLLCLDCGAEHEAAAAPAPDRDHNRHPLIWRTLDGYTLRSACDEDGEVYWTDGDLCFDSKNGVPVTFIGEPLDGGLI